MPGKGVLFFVVWYFATWVLGMAPGFVYSLYRRIFTSPGREFHFESDDAVDYVLKKSIVFFCPKHQNGMLPSF